MRDYFTAIKCDICESVHRLDNGAYLRKGMDEHTGTYHVKIFMQHNLTKQILRFDICKVCLDKIIPGWAEPEVEEIKADEQKAS